jgi:seryl-tRNA synthetase
MFHQRELVRIGEVLDVLAWRELWMTRATSIFERVGLAADFSIAADAFFGRRGMLLANSQREQRLKFEFRAPIGSHEPSAVASFNFHQDYFAAAFGIRLHDGGTANSACVGFGLERIALALFRAHGSDLRTWPKDVRDQLWPGGTPPGR